MAKKILIKPLITEKSENQTETFNQYGFIVHKNANKVEIKAAIKSTYGVEPSSVNTMIIPAKTKMRHTKRGRTIGRKPSYKKAIVTLQEGDVIDFYGEV